MQVLEVASSIPTIVRKRDGRTTQSFDPLKIEKAVRAAWREAEGLVDEDALRRVTQFLLASLPAEVADVEQIQDSVEVALMRARKFAVAKAFIIYRQKRSEMRAERKKPDARAVMEYIHASKYARYLPDLQRREVHTETVARVEDMHLRRFAYVPELLPEIRSAFDLVREKRVLPSMRSMQFGGKAVEAANARLFNCSATLIDRPRAFAEALYLLLCGTGIGYSIQFEHVDKLPQLASSIDTSVVTHHAIQDTVEGWAEALNDLIFSYIEGTYIEFSYLNIRPAGAPLKTSGGRAPGHLGLKTSLDLIRHVLDGALGRKLRPIECHRILCMAADAVLSGGIRRSASIALFSFEDSEMMYCKSERSWFSKEPWFKNANNSVVLKRGDVREAQFKRIFGMTRNFGEPGIFFVDDINHVCNPCVEIGLDPVYIDASGNKSTGWAMCNLTIINAAKLTSLQDYLESAKAATLIGTLQAAYSDLPYLGSVTEAIVRRDALLGVSMTGMQDSPQIACNPEFQRTVAEKINEWNAQFARTIGINSAARTTCVKPEGTSSLALGSVGSGIHPHHSRRYIRRVTADSLEIVFQAFKSANPHMCVKMPSGKWSIEFPVEAPEGAALKEDFTAADFMGMVRSTQQNWVVPGTVRESHVPGLRHNVSNTISVKNDEWDGVADYLWEHRSDLTGVSLLPDEGDQIYPFAPFEAVKTEAQERRWNELVEHYVPIDYYSLVELEDGTALRAEAACAGGSCSIV